jgi:peptidoglycan/LPS O-acetylase OafA/YrhL
VESTADRRNNFDLLRLIAALQVAVVHGLHHLLHAPRAVEAIINTVPGVPVFFVISGFLISRSYERSDLRTFTVNRVLRIYPALWVNVVVSILFAASVFTIVASYTQISAWLLAQFTILQFYNPDWLRGFGVGVLNGSLWSIPVELQFYIALPILYWLGWIGHEKRFRVLLVASFVVYTAFMFWDTRHRVIYSRMAGVTVVPYLFLFLLGVAAQRHFARLRPVLAGKALYWIGGYAGASLLAYRAGLNASGNLLNPALVLIMTGMILSCAYTCPSLADRMLRRNDISYGLYIYHMPVFNGFIAFGLTGTITGLVGALAVAVACAALSWFLIERHALKLKSVIVRPIGVAP